MSVSQALARTHSIVGSEPASKCAANGRIGGRSSADRQCSVAMTEGPTPDLNIMHPLGLSVVVGANETLSIPAAAPASPSILTTIIHHVLHIPDSVCGVCRDRSIIPRFDLVHLPE